MCKRVSIPMQKEQQPGAEVRPPLAPPAGLNEECGDRSISAVGGATQRFVLLWLLHHDLLSTSAEKSATELLRDS